MTNSFNSYDDNKIDGKIYFYKSRINEKGEKYKGAEVLLDKGKTMLSEKNKDPGSTLKKYNVLEKVELFESNLGQQKIWCWLVESDDENMTSGLHISRRTKKGQIYANQEITLSINAINSLKQYLDEIKICKTDEALKIKTISLNDERHSIITIDEFKRIIDNNITSIDDYYRIIDIKRKNEAIERLKEIISGKYKNEIEIQKFLKNNYWLFGNEYCSIVEDEKINVKNILDAVPQNLESFVDIIEVKLPKEELFHLDQSHNNYYPSSSLTKAIAQTQNYVFEMETLSNSEEYQQNNNCRIVRPRGIILIGSKNQLNPQEQKYLRILNASFHNLVVITYQQLLLKAENLITYKK